MCVYVPNIMSLVLLMLRVSLFTLSHFEMLFKFALSSDCKVRESFELHKRVVSSAYITHLQDTQSASELTKIINNNGQE